MRTRSRMATDAAVPVVSVSASQTSKVGISAFDLVMSGYTTSGSRLTADVSEAGNAPIQAHSSTTLSAAIRAVTVV